MQPMEIAVFGLGRFGAFWAELLRPLGTVYGYNRSSRPLPPEVRPIALEDIGRVDAIFLCAAISAMTEVCAQIAPFIGPSTTVLDTCSVKVFPADAMARLLPEGVPIVPLHPMFGPDSAGDHEHGRPLVLCPDPRGSAAGAAAADAWAALFADLGLTVHRMTPDQHDLEAARTQGITHFIGRLLGDLGLQPSPIGTLGYRKIFEVMEQTCNDPWQLFLDLQKYNPHTRPVREDLDKSFRKLIDTLATLTEKSDG